MSIKSRKVRETIERENRILAVAQDQILRDGYHGLNMDRIADSIQYSKGTIYNHFPNKEEIIAALGIRTTERRIELFGKAVQFDGLARERMQAIGVASELFARLFPHHFYLEQMIRISSIWEKTSPKRQEQYQACEMQCMNTVAGVVRAGVAEGNLLLPGKFGPEDLVFGLWSLVSGAYSLAACNPNLSQLGIGEPYSSVRVLANRLLDGFNWSPLSNERDYDEIALRVTNGHFSHELTMLTQQNVQISECQNPNLAFEVRANHRGHLTNS